MDPFSSSSTNSFARERTNCVHIQLYKDLKERQKNGQTKASLSLQQYLGFESGFTLDKESNTLAILCEDVVQHNLGSSREFPAVVVAAPRSAGVSAGPEHPVSTDVHTAASSLYDTPKKLKCLIGHSCGCNHETKNDENQTETSDNNEQTNYANLSPPPKPPQIDLTNYANIDRATLEEFENSLRILRSAGFSQEELDALDDIPEHDDDLSSTTTNTVHMPTEYCNDHISYMHLEESSMSSNSKHLSDNISRISHFSDPTHSETDNTTSTRRSSSADFTKRLDDEYPVCFTPTVIRRTCKTECITEGIPVSNQNDFKQPEPKAENALVARFRDAVKIRRSSSVPSKSDKNRDSSSSNDSGVSTGSLKHHKGDFNEFESSMNNSKATKKYVRNKPFRNTLMPVHGPFLKSSSSDPLKNLTFQFEEVATMTKSNSCEAETLTRRKKKNGKFLLSLDNLGIIAR
ncbi:unnamed protein product [Leptidea sinapis]|uniref:Uncharacterized protein n=1 Tax=Leptidea sinapis TaxID=189913 RepID=A0A5E4Q8F1_9NEOP|nr:unnamed protein product [Leptidea sinapis]